MRRIARTARAQLTERVELLDLNDAVAEGEGHPELPPAVAFLTQALAPDASERAVRRVDRGERHERVGFAVLVVDVALFKAGRAVVACMKIIIYCGCEYTALMPLPVPSVLKSR